MFDMKVIKGYHLLFFFSPCFKQIGQQMTADYGPPMNAHLQRVKSGEESEIIYKDLVKLSFGK